MFNAHVVMLFTCIMQPYTYMYTAVVAALQSSHTSVVLHVIPIY